MKGKRILAVFAACTMLTASAASLAACGGENGSALGKTQLNIANYAVDYAKYVPTEYSASAKAVSSVKQLNDISNTYYELSFNTDCSLTVVQSGATYSIYDVEKENYLYYSVSGGGFSKIFWSRPTLSRTTVYDYTDASGYSNFYTYCIFASTPTGNGYDVYSDTGVKLLYEVDGYSLSLTLESVNVGGSVGYAKILSVKGRDYNTYQYKTNSFIVEIDKDNNITKYEPYSADAFKTDTDTTVGSSLGVIPEYVYPYNEEEPVSGTMADYKFNKMGNTYQFYNGKDKKGSVQVKNEWYHEFVDNYMYFAQLNPVAPDAQSGYNYFSEGTKYNYTLSRYDILKNSVQKLNYNVVIKSIEPIYNFDKKVYDAAMLQGYEKIDGIAYSSADGFLYMADKNLKVGYDLDAFASSGLMGVAKLTDEYYVAVTAEPKSYVTDKNLNILYQMSGLPVLDKGIIMYTDGGLYGLATLEGKILTEPKYSQIGKFYGDTAYAIEVNGTEERQVFIKSDGTTTFDFTTASAANETVTVYGGFYTLSDSATASLANSLSVYSYSGTLLKTFTFDSNFRPSNLSFVKAGNSYIIKETRGTSYSPTYNYYKIG